MTVDTRKFARTELTGVQTLFGLFLVYTPTAPNTSMSPNSMFCTH